MKRIYFVSEFIFVDRIYFTLEYMYDGEGFITENGRVRNFETIEFLRDYCRQNNISCDFEKESFMIHDIEALDDWMKKRNNLIYDNFILNSWNTMDDVASSIEEKFLGDDHSFDDLYDKLVYAFDPLLFEESKKSALSKFSDEDFDRIHKVMEHGRSIIDKAFSRS